MKEKRSRKTGWVLGLLLILAALAIQPEGDRPAAAQAEPDAATPGWVETPHTPADAPPDSFTGTYVVIRFNDCAIHATADCISVARARLLADQLDEAWDLFMDYGFNEPYAGSGPPLPVWVFSPLVDDAFGWARGGHIEVRPDRIQTSAADVHRGTPHHELFHMVQRTYPNGEPGWVKEGTAKFIEDMVFDDLDANGSSQYVARVARYLANPNLQGWDEDTSTAAPGGLFEASYNAALIWKYLTEQYGGTSDPYFGDEPQYGIDFMVDFWVMSQTRNGIDAVNAALPPGVTFTDVFKNFLIANYLKRFNVSPTYTYADDPGPAFAYREVKLVYGSEVMPILHLNQRVEDWGAIYYVGEPFGTCPFIQVAIGGDPGSLAYYSVFATRGNDAFYYDHPGFRTFARNFTKTFVNDSYDRVVAVVGGLHNPAEYSISIRCATPSLNIVEPRQDLFAEAGDPDQPRRIMVLLELTGADDSFVEGITWEEFEVFIGGIPAEIVTGAYVQRQYWLIVQPPTQTVSGDPPWFFDLDVSLAGLSDHEDGAVHYRPLPNYDEVLVIDTSGSMSGPYSYPKIRAAKNAAKLYIDELANNDRMGAVEFNTTASSLWNGMAEVNDLTRVIGKLLIENLEPGGCTSIGGGLLEALSVFEHPSYPGSPENSDVIVLLSDGMENTSPCWEYHAPNSCPDPPYHDCSTGPYVRDQVIESGIPVNTVALGSGSHEELMARIAEETGGIYRFANLPGGLDEQAVQDQSILPEVGPPLGVPEAPAQETFWALRLADIYDFFEGEMEGRERILLQDMTIPDDLYEWHETPVYLDHTVSYVTVSIAYDTWSKIDSAGSCGMVRTVELISPSNTAYSPTFSDGYHDVFEVSSPAPGTWVARVKMMDKLCAASFEGEKAPNIAPYHYQVIVSGQTSLATEVRVGSLHSDRYIGLCVPIYATFLGASGPVQQGFLTAMITTPTGSQIPVLLSDDGNHGDGAAGDGIYAGLFCRGSEPGTYTVDVRGRIEAMAGTIRRIATASFYIQDDDDTDGDGLPDQWELAHGLHPSLPDDSANPDLDLICAYGCIHYKNSFEYLYGTDPNNDDSDGGGEMDGSELLWGQDPNGPEDDMVEIPTSFAVTPGTNENVITYDARPADDTNYLFWSTDPQMGDLLAHMVDIGNTGFYTHTGLTNDTTYYYLLVAVRAGHMSGYAKKIAATPALDPTPPQGNVLINNDALRANSLNVVLTIYTTDDAVEMLISNVPEFTGAEWEPLADTRNWRISITPEGAAFVYARFRDAAGNVSDVAIDGILAPLTLYLPVIPSK
jgi:hypothetical protein